MTPAEALETHRRFINELGEDIAIRRYTGSGPTRTHADTTTRARVMFFQPNPLIGPAVQGDRKVITLVDNLSGILPVTTDDRAVIGGVPLAIKAVDDNTRRIVGTLIALELTVSG